MNKIQLKAGDVVRLRRGGTATITECVDGPRDRKTYKGRLADGEFHMWAENGWSDVFFAVGQRDASKDIVGRLK